MYPENKERYQSEKEAIHLLLTGIGDEIYSSVDACKTTHDVELMESYYSRFYKMMNEMIRSNLTVAKMQVNVQFLQQLQPEWSRFVTIVKHNHDLDIVSYHKLVDILKQYKKEVNEIHLYYQAPKSHKSFLPPSKQSSSTRSNATTKLEGKEIAKPITSSSESASEENSNLEQAQRDKDMQKNLALVAKYFKKLYKPTKNNLRTSSNSKNKNVDTDSRYKNDNQTGQFRNHKTMSVAGARETVGSQVVQQTGIQCFNYKEFGHFAMECRKPKRVKDYTYHKEKMLLCKQAEKGVPLKVEHASWLKNTDEYIDEQELEAHYSYMEKIQEEKMLLCKQAEKGVPLKVEHASWLKNTDEYIDEQELEAHYSYMEKIQEIELEKYTAFNDRTVIYDKLEHKLNETLWILAQKEIDIKEEFSNMYDLLLQKCVSKDVTCSYLHSLSEIDAHAKLQCLYVHKVKECECLAQKLSKQTETVSKEVYNELSQSFAKLKKHSISLELALQQCKEQMKNDKVCKEAASNVFKKESEQYHEIQDLKAQFQDKNIAIRVIHKTNVSKSLFRSTQMKDKVVPNNIQVKVKKTEVEDNLRISSISNKTKFVIAYTDSRYKNDNQTGQFRNHRTMSVDGARETVGSQETKKGKRLHVSQGKDVVV
nr:hypothetical protein [Tanacetum cinerariifolium]